MKRVLSFKEHQKSIKMAEELIEMIISPKVNESEETETVNKNQINKIAQNLANDLKFNFGLVATFGTGIRAMYPVVDNLIKNSTLKIEATQENIVLLTITALCITYLEERNNREGSKEIVCHDCNGNSVKNSKDEATCATCNGVGSIKSEVTKQDTDTLLAELKLRGIGDGIVKKVISCFRSIGNIFKIIFKNTPYVINGFIDMFGYNSLLIPSMNAISALIGQYHFDINNLAMNLLSVGLGVGTFLAKGGFNYLVNKLKDKYNLKINPDLEDSIVTKSIDINDGENSIEDQNLIKEQ